MATPNPGPNERLSELVGLAANEIRRGLSPLGDESPALTFTAEGYEVWLKAVAGWALVAAGVPELLAEVERLREALQHARNELDRWGFGDFHYGETPRDQRILTALEIADAALASEDKT